ncbi:MAG TPA: hypothetical protein VE291_00680, partial [Terracidiphilus sp.]|nr:hypothetical protein [Terracidiphilus sp.]
QPRLGCRFSIVQIVQIVQEREEKLEKASRLRLRLHRRGAPLRAHQCKTHAKDSISRQNSKSH